MPVTPPFAHLVSEWRLRHALLRDALPGFATTPHYASHPVANTAPEGVFVWPISVYLDGVKFARQDSVLGIWIACHLTGKRFLCANMRKSELCTCGCRGWCSLWPVFSMMDWAHDALAEGRYPSDAPPTVTFDEGRRTMANVPFGFRAAVLFIRGDWSEYTSSLGLPNWKTIHNHVPCVAVNERTCTSTAACLRWSCPGLKKRIACIWRIAIALNTLWFRLRRFGDVSGQRLRTTCQVQLAGLSVMISQRQAYCAATGSRRALNVLTSGMDSTPSCRRK